MRLILIRHGQTPSNVLGLIDTRIPGPGLTELGLVQAAAIPLALADESIDALFASVQVRSQLTAAPLSTKLGLEVSIRPGIREIDSGDLQMLGDIDSVHSYMSTILAWVAGDHELRMPGGESGLEVFARFDAVVAEADAAGHETVAIVAHGAIIRMWAGGRARNTGAEFATRNILENTGIVILEGSPAMGWDALSWMGVVVEPSVSVNPA
jgi:broad specificity phosphatase PhoE